MGRFLSLVLCQVAAAWAERLSCPYYQAGEMGRSQGWWISGSAPFSPSERVSPPFCTLGCQASYIYRIILNHIESHWILLNHIVAWKTSKWPPIKSGEWLHLGSVGKGLWRRRAPDDRAQCLGECVDVLSLGPPLDPRWTHGMPWEAQDGMITWFSHWPRPAGKRAAHVKNWTSDKISTGQKVKSQEGFFFDFLNWNMCIISVSNPIPVICSTSRCSFSKLSAVTMERHELQERHIQQEQPMQESKVICFSIWASEKVILECRWIPNILNTTVARKFFRWQ